jgi:hypothetical protein
MVLTIKSKDADWLSGFFKEKNNSNTDKWVHKWINKYII